MTTSSAELMADAAEFVEGREVAIACTSCPRRWYVHLQDGEELSTEESACPMRGCDGEGEEI